MSKDIELFKFARLYLGTENWKYAKDTSESELSLFKKFSINLKNSYIVYGSKDLLHKFKAFYLTRCLKERPLYMQCFITDYANELMINTKDDYGLNVDQDLIFLYIHEHSISSLGRSETWLTETVLNKVASRNRDGLVTIILSEIKVPSLEVPNELEVINLSGVALNETKKEALKTDFTNGIGRSNQSTVY